MVEMSYAPVYEEWVDLMEAKGTPEKQVAFMEGIFRYAFGGERAPDPRGMEAPHGVDYARYDGYVLCRKTMDRMRKTVAAGQKAGRPGRPQGSGRVNAAKPVPHGGPETGGVGGGDADGVDMPPPASAPCGDGPGADGAADAQRPDPPDAPAQVAAMDGFDAGRSCASPQLPTESEMQMFADNVGVPKDYLPKFLARQREIGWEYVNHAGSVVRLNRRNFKSVLRLFWEREAQDARRNAPGRGGGGGGAQPEGVVLKGEMVNDYGF